MSTTRTLKPQERGLSLDDCLRELDTQGWRVVGVLWHERLTAETRVIVERQPRHDRRAGT